MTEHETHFDDGEWHALTLGQFIALLVDAGDEDVAIAFRVVEDGDSDTKGNFVRQMDVILMPNGHVISTLETDGITSVHKTLKKLIEAGLVD